VKSRGNRTWRKKYQSPPLPIVELRDRSRYLAGLVLDVRRYPLACPQDCHAPQPLLMVSAGRSGTTLLRSMLVTGGQIAIPPETQVVHLAARKFVSCQHLGWPDLARLIVALFESHRLFHIWDTDLRSAYQQAMQLDRSERSLARIIDMIFACYANQHFPEASIWGDQSPIHTFFLPWVTSIFPRAKYLHIVRDGRDVISSFVARGDNLEEATYRWLEAVRRALHLGKRLAPDQWSEIQYEQLVSRPVESLKMISRFVGIDYTPCMLDFWQAPTTVEPTYHSHHSNLTKPVFTDSIGKWRERLSPSQQSYVQDKTSGLLERLGYM
jgi:protein-tyrosine sulfotransferase